MELEVAITMNKTCRRSERHVVATEEEGAKAEEAPAAEAAAEAAAEPLKEPGFVIATTGTFRCSIEEDLDFRHDPTEFMEPSMKPLPPTAEVVCFCVFVHACSLIISLAQMTHHPRLSRRGPLSITSRTSLAQNR